MVERVIVGSSTVDHCRCKACGASWFDRNKGSRREAWSWLSQARHAFTAGPPISRRLVELLTRSSSAAFIAGRRLRRRLLREFSHRPTLDRRL